MGKRKTVDCEVRGPDTNLTTQPPKPEKRSYYEKLRDPRWQKKRLEIMERDGFACRGCGDKDSTLNVHHGYYKKGCDPWEYHQSTLVTLCEKCHSLYELGREVILAELVRMSPSQQSALFEATQCIELLDLFVKSKSLPPVAGIDATSIYNEEPSDECDGPLGVLLQAACAARRSLESGKDYANLIYLMHNWSSMQFAVRGLVEMHEQQEMSKEFDLAHMTVDEIEGILAYAKNRDAMCKEAVS